MKHVLAVSSLAVFLSVGVGNLVAQERQGRPNFDPAEMQQRMMERYKEDLGVQNADEWKIVSERITKVMEARRQVGFGGMGRGMGGPRGNRGGGDNAAQADRRPPGFEPNPIAEELQKAIDANGSADQIKSLLAKYRDDRKQKQAKLEQAQEELKKVLSVRQEAIAVMRGLCN